MTITPPTAGPIDTSLITSAFRANPDPVSLGYREAETYTAMLERLMRWTVFDLIPYLSTNFEDIQDSWVQNVTDFVDVINAGLAEQSADNAAAIAQGLSDIANSSVGFTNTALTAAFNDTSSSFRAAMDTHFGTSAVSDASVAAVLDSTASAAKIAARAKLATHYGERFLIVNDLPGIVLDGSADVSGILATAISGLTAGGYSNLVILPNTFGKSWLRIDSTLVVDIAKAGIVCPYGGVEFKATQNTTTPAMQVVASAAVPNNSMPGGPTLGPFRLTGPGRTVTASTGILFANRSGDAGVVRGLATRDIVVEEFWQGHSYGTSAYLIDHYNTTVKGCNTAVVVPTATESGERITYHGGTLSDCPIVVNMANGNADLYFANCSFDYFTDSAVILSNGSVTLRDCHVEANTLSGHLWFQLHGGNFLMSGGWLIRGNSSTTPDYIVWNDSDGTKGLAATFENVMFNNLATVNSVLAGGTGNTIVRNSRTFGASSQAGFFCTASVANLLANGSFDTTSGLQDQWFVSNDTGTMLDSANSLTTITGSNVSATFSTDIKRSGTNSLKITKVGAAGTAAAVSVAVPIRGGTLTGHLGWLARHATLSGTVQVNGFFAKMAPSSLSSGRTRAAVTASAGSRTVNVVSDLASIDTWVSTVSQTLQIRAPQWATHYIFEISVSNMGAGSLYLDDLLITEF